MAAPPIVVRTPTLKSEFISVGCNRLVNVLDWSSSNLVAYAAEAMVAIFNQQRATVVRTLLAHTKRVNAVRWLPSETAGPLELVSGGADNRIAQWTISSDGTVCTLTSSFEAHADSVTALASIRLPSGELLLASSSADCTICIWKRVGNSEWSKIQTMSMKPRQPECIAFGFAPGAPDTPLLAVGGTDPVIRLYVWDTKAHQFGKSYELLGHEDWIRSLAFCTCPNSDVLLASSGQDNYVRLWRMTSSTTAQGKGLLVHAASGSTIAINIDSVLSGHEDWVYSVAWRPPQRGADGKLVQHMELLSASMDRTTTLWAPLEESPDKSGEGMWSTRARMGEMGVRITRR